MNITPINFNRFNATRFKSLNKKPQDNSNSFKSCQNNSPDVFFHKYLFTEVNNRIKGNAGLMSGLMQVGPDGEIDASPELDKFCDADNSNKYDIKTSIRLKDYKMQAYILGLPPEELKEKVPSIIKVSSQDFLKRIDDEIVDCQGYVNIISEPLALSIFNHAMNTNYTPKDLPAFKQKVDELKAVKNYLLKKPEELQESLDMLALAYNYKIYQILMNGFNCDARQTLMDLSNYGILSPDFEVSKENEDVLLYTYKTNLGTLEVRRNKNNMDYISAKLENTDDDLSFDVKFNKDGSIQSLSVFIPFDNSNIFIQQEVNSNIATVGKYLDEHLETKRFIKHLDGLIELG